MATKGKAGSAGAKPQTSAEKTYASAMDKLRDEMATDGSEYVRVVGEYLTNYLLEHPEAEGALLDSAKTIHGSLKGIEDEARKNKQGNVGIVSDLRAFALVLEYFGINDRRTTGTKSVAALRAAPPSPTGEGIEKPGTVDKNPSPLGKVATKGTDEAPVDPFDLDALLEVG